MDSGADPLTLSGNGSFSFAKPVAQLGSYAVTVSTAPASQDCVVANGSGSQVTANVSSITVTCTTKSFTVTGTVGGLTGGGYVVLSDNGGDLQTVAANGSFSFATKVDYGNPYAVAVVTAPFGQGCAISNSSSASVTANISTVGVVCIALPQYAYIVDARTGTILEYSISSTGDWVPLAIPATPPFMQPQSIVIDAKGRHAYVANYDEGLIDQYDVGPTGELTPSAIPSVGDGDAPVTVFLDPLGRYAYSNGLQFDTIGQFSIDASGSLVGLTPQNIPGGGFGESMVFSPSGQNAYLLRGDGLAQYSIGPQGSLVALTPPTVPAPYHDGVTIDSSGANLYVLDELSGVVAQYVTNASGLLTQTPTLVAAGSPVYMAIHPTRLYSYIVSATGNGTGSIYQFSIAGDGTLTPMSTRFLPSGTNPVAMALDRTGTYVFVTNLDGSLSRFSIGESGALTAMSTIVPTPATSPLAMAITN